MKNRIARLALLAPFVFSLIMLPAVAPPPVSSVAHASPANGCRDAAYGFPHPDTRPDLFAAPIVWNAEDFIRDEAAAPRSANSYRFRGVARAEVGLLRR